MVNTFGRWQILVKVTISLDIRNLKQGSTQTLFTPRCKS